MLPMIVAAYKACIPNFIAQMMADFTSEVVAIAEAAVRMAMALVKDQVVEVLDDMLERELSKLEEVGTLRDPCVEAWHGPAKRFVRSTTSWKDLPLVLQRSPTRCRRRLGRRRRLLDSPCIIDILYRQIVS